MSGLFIGPAKLHAGGFTGGAVGVDPGVGAGPLHGDLAWATLEQSLLPPDPSGAVQYRVSTPSILQYQVDQVVHCASVHNVEPPVQPHSGGDWE
jgi:hypothetical protein